MFTHKHTLPRFIKRERERTSEQITAHETFQIHTSQATSLTSINVDGTIKGDRFICSGDLDVKPLIEQKKHKRIWTGAINEIGQNCVCRKQIDDWFFLFAKIHFFHGLHKEQKIENKSLFYSFIFMNKKCARTNLLSIIWGEFHILFNSNKWNSIVIGCQPTRGFKCMSQRYSSVVLNLLVNNGVDCLVTNRAWKAIGKCFVAIHTGVNRWLCAQTVTRMTHLKRADHLWSNRSIDRVVSHTPAL